MLPLLVASIASSPVSSLHGDESSTRMPLVSGRASCCGCALGNTPTVERSSLREVRGDVLIACTLAFVVVRDAFLLTLTLPSKCCRKRRSDT